IKPEDLDRPALEARLEEARKGHDAAEEGSEEQARLRRDVARLEAFLRVEG
ncbi:MAG: hypothetical protein GXY03_16430, partial [Solirubrobacterales bacterium]|nr:hypothetical protein [Solirubrobacterales bacterium]